MAIIKCPECGADVSSSARACVKCGYPICESEFETRNRPGKYASQSHNSRLNPIILIIIIVILLILILLFFVRASVQMRIASPTATTLGQTVNADSPSKSQTEDIAKTRSSLTPYLDVLGMEINDPNVSATTDFINGLSSVYIMGRVGSVSHGFNGNSTLTIELLEWTENGSSTESEYQEFINNLNLYFESTGICTDEYSYIADECYLWFDPNYKCCAIMWYDGEKLNMKWDYTLKSLSNAEHTCAAQESLVSTVSAEESFGSSIRKTTSEDIVEECISRAKQNLGDAYKGYTVLDTGSGNYILVINICTDGFWDAYIANDSDWKDLISASNDLSSTTRGLFVKAGYSNWAVSIMLLNDHDQERVLYTSMNGAEFKE